MAYTAKTWVTGEVIQAVDLNHAENGIAEADAKATAISANGAIGTANLADGAVTLQKLGADVMSHFALADDVDELKNAVEQINDVLDMPFYASSSGTTPSDAQANLILGGLEIVAYHEYTITLTYASASDAVSYLYLTDENINVLTSKTITAGTTVTTFQYIPNSSYSNAKLLVNSTRKALNYTIECKDNAESRIDVLENDKLDKSVYSNNVTATFASAGTQTPSTQALTNHVYKIQIDGESSVGVNVRGGNGLSVVGDIATNCVGGKTYIAKYDGDNSNNLIIFASGACSVIVEDLSSMQSMNDRIEIPVSTVAELISAIEISHTVKATIRLSAGTYDLIAGLGSSYFENAPARNFGLVLCNDVILIGEEGSVITANYTGTNVNVMTYFAAFNTGKCVYPWTLYGGFELRNIHLQGSKIRYLIHDENNDHPIPYHNVYDGCKFYFDNSGNTAWTSKAIIGGGLGKHGYIEIKHCIFETATLASRSAVVSYHNSTAENAKSHIIVSENLIAPVNAIFRLGYHGTSTEKTTVLATGNKWGGTPSISAETAQDTEQNIELIEWNNVVIS